MRWTKDGKFVGISLGLMTGGRQVWDVDTNVDWATLSVELRRQPERADVAGLEELRGAVAKWAARHGFEPE